MAPDLDRSAGYVTPAPTPYFADDLVTLYKGDALETLRCLPAGSVDCIVTSPPYYGLRDYEVDGQYGMEASPAEYVETMRAVFAEARRVLAIDGTLWLNLGDSYSGSWGNQGRKQERGTQRPINGPMMQPVDDGRYPTTGSNTGAIKPGAPPAKNLMGMPWRVAFALQDDGWTLRSDIIWAKPNPMPEPVTDRPTSAHEYVFLFTRSRAYHYDAEAIAETATGRGSGNGFHWPEAINRGGPGQDERWEGRPQLRRALQIAADAGLTEAHFAAIRAIGMSDAGKAKVNQSGTGRNTAEAQALADEAKQALGGYYREFLTGGTKNARDVWAIPVVGFSRAHFAVMSPALAERCVLAGCKPGGTVLDPFSGSGTTGMVAAKLGRRYVGIDLSAEYLDLSLETRLAQTALCDVPQAEPLAAEATA